VRIKNVSPDLAFHPTDPAFNRYFSDAQRSQELPTAYTYVEVDGQRYPGSAVRYPFDAKLDREYVEGQAEDNRPLRPGEERAYVIAAYTHPDNRKLLDALKRAGRGKEVLWRVQLRRGLVPWKDQEVAVTAVIGVKFTPGDVKKG
jgi:hypothetical protein